MSYNIPANGLFWDGKLTVPIHASRVLWWISMDRTRRWVHTWAAMPMLAEPDKLPPKAFVSTSWRDMKARQELTQVVQPHQTRDTLAFPNTTIRQTVKVTLGTGQYFRLRLSNVFGMDDLMVNQITVALAHNNKSGSSKIQVNTLQSVTFDDGQKSTTIVDGAQAVSDPIDFGFPLLANTVLSISLFFEKGQDGQTGITLHPGSRTTSFCSLGNCVSEPDLTDPSVEEVEHW